jgi:endonuclease YncB( thermonuclease family)
MGQRARITTYLLVIALLAGLAAFPRTQAAGELTGQVVAVMDGDTVGLLVDRQEFRVRLYQIDAPEKRQAFGQRSKQSLSELVYGRTVKAVTAGEDRYGRTLATLYAGDLNVNAEQVRRGMAWVYRRYARDPSLFTHEYEARAARRGLWADPDPIPPWEWRHRDKAPQ